MIPAGFEYHRPSDIASALAVLQEHGDEARVVAGGHSLIPMMKLRMASLGHLIDLQDVDGLRGISTGPDMISLGAMTTQAEIIAHDGLTSAVPILKEAALLIADPQVRNMGTVGGNVANGDPGNDMPAIMQCLDATYVLVGPEGERSVKARAFYEAAYFTARSDEEILTRVEIPTPPKHGYAYEKQKRKIGDYATAAAAVTIGAGTASVALTNLSDTPIWSEAASAALGDGNVEGAVGAAMGDIDPQEDMRGPVAFKRHVAEVMLRRAISRAQERMA